jgi:hypothetical protein
MTPDGVDRLEHQDKTMNTHDLAEAKADYRRRGVGLPRSRGNRLVEMG